MVEVIFWIAVAGLAYVYAGYPALARLWAAIFPVAVRSGPLRPSVTIVITAYNEELGIVEKLRSVGALDYPRQLTEIVVASDGSTDQTDELVRRFRDFPVKLLRVEGRVGKTACQNRAVEHASGEILVFTDATTAIEPDALARIVENFADPTVGCVAGSLVYVAKDAGLTARGGASYWGYEFALRKAESDLGSLVGVSGCLYAVRRSAYRPIPADLISDFVVAFRMREQGLRTVLETGAVCYEETHDRGAQELGMRVRVAIRSLHALVRERRLLNPLRFGRFAWQLWSHKVLRYASPLLWMVALGSNLALAQDHVYRLTLIGQLLILAAGAFGWLLHGSGTHWRLLEKPYYFLLTNVASLFALFRYLTGERAVTWTPARGGAP